jgi:hypothetical protein
VMNMANGTDGRQRQDGHVILNNRFSMKFPPEWSDRSVYRFEGPVDDGIQDNIIVTIENNVDVPDLDTYANLQIKAVQEALQGFSELKQGPLELDSRIPAYELVYKWYPIEDREIYQRVVYVLHGGNGYIITASFSKKTWKMRAAFIDKVLKSFTIG